MSLRALNLIAGLVGATLYAQSAIAQPIPINLPSVRAEYSGSWYQPEQSGHGLMLEILDRQRAVLAWYTYDRTGAPLWLFGTGTIEFNEVTVELSAFEGGRPPADWADGDLQATPWGIARLAFAGCNDATLSWDADDPDFGSGELSLKRLSWLQGERCNAEEFFSVQLHYSFERRRQGFEAVFADLPADYAPETYELDYRRELLPVPLGDYAGLRLTGHNRSDDLAMLITAPVAGLLPASLYRVEVEAEIASNVAAGCAGVGGSPGDSVFLKLGAANVKPQAVVDPADGWLRLNIDYGQQGNAGANARLVGTLANSQTCEHGVETDWETKRVTTEGQPLFVESDAVGRLWVFAGSDSAFEGRTQYYILSLTVRLEPYEMEQ